jgi:hypothetical protein
MKPTETEFFYNAVMASLKSRRESKHRRNDLVDLMVDAIKGEVTEDKEHEDNQFEKDAKLNHQTKKGEFDELTIGQRPYAMLKAPVPSITVVKQH